MISTVMHPVRFLVRGVACVLVTGTVALADPAPGTPGNSGNSNPHGSPPGQGGTAPGKSGSSNPHGTPPGQRIVAPPAGTLPGPAPARTPAQSSPAPEYPHSMVNPWMQCPPRCDGSPELDRYREVLKVLGSVKGWEPDWRTFAEPLYAVSLVVHTSRTVNGTVMVQELRWSRLGSRERGWELLHTGETHEWLLHPGVSWGRWHKGPWRKSAVGPQKRLMDLGWDRGSVIELAWGATGLSVDRNGHGYVYVQFMRRDGKGRMAWEVEGGSRLLRRIKAWNGLGEPEWEETREYRIISGRLLMVFRRRIIPGGELTEHLEWSTESVDEAGFQSVAP